MLEQGIAEGFITLPGRVRLDRQDHHLLLREAQVHLEARVDEDAVGAVDVLVEAGHRGIRLVAEAGILGGLPGHRVGVVQAEAVADPLAAFDARSMAEAIARCAVARWPEDTPAAAPFYVRAPEAAPARDAPPPILA